jgi:KDO2-lipid IV(A) lauroyltransferase
MVLMLGDQSASRESLFIDFFGRPAATHRGPALFALKTGAPMVMGLLLRQSDGRYAAEFEEIPHDDLHGASERNVAELTRRHTAVLERYIRLYPDHWLWMHKRWKHTPSPQQAEPA